MPWLGHQDFELIVKRGSTFSVFINTSGKPRRVRVSWSPGPVLTSKH